MANVQWSLIEPGLLTPFVRGELVSAEAGGLPVYEVLAVSGGRAWLREQATGRDHVLPTQSLHWRLQRPAIE